MSQRSTRRVIGGVSAFAVAAGFAVTAGVGAASAAPATVEWDGGNMHYTRTLSNTTPAVGEVVTTSTKFEWTYWATGEYIYGVKDVHPTCLTFVPGSAKMNGTVQSNPEVAADYAKVTAGLTEWPIGVLANGKTRTFEFSYTVGANCDRDVALMTTLHKGGSLGDGTFQDKGPTVTVAKSSSTTSLAAVSGAVTGLPVTLSSTVTGGADGDTVEFYDGSTKLGTGALANGTATYSWTPSTGGSHTLTAKYLGSASTSGSTSAAQNVTVTVPDAATTTTVSGPSSVVEGDEVTLSAQVSPAPGGGTVQFRDGGADLGAAVAVGADGSASLVVPSLSAGAHEVTAVFSGVTGFTGSTSVPFTVTSTVADVATQTTLSAPATASEGDSVTIAAQVSPVPTGGTVQFRDGGVDLGAPVAVGADGSASIDQVLSVGAHEVTAVFSGAAGFVGSTSEARTVTVSQAAPVDVATGTVLSVPVSARTGDAVHLYATVTGTDAAPIGSVGAVEFTVDGQSVGTVAVVDGVADLTHTFTSTGSKTVSASYSGGAGYTASTAQSATVTVTDPDPTDVETATVVTVPASAVQGASVTLSATVSPTPAGGSVQFFDGTTPIGVPVTVVDGKATRSYTFATAGDRQVTAVYSGTSGYLGSTSSAASVLVTEPATDPGTGGSGSLENIFGS